MIKAIVNPPPPDRRYLHRMAHQGIRVVGGVMPTGKFPRAVGSGIFGVEGQDQGVFDGPAFPNSNTGIFYNDYAKDSWEVQQPDLEWVMLRRPGRPLFPGSSAHGIVLIGPSMGNDDCACAQQNGAQQNGAQQSSGFIDKLITGAALVGGAWFILHTMKKFAEEG